MATPQNNFGVKTRKTSAFDLSVSTEAQGRRGYEFNNIGGVLVGRIDPNSLDFTKGSKGNSVVLDTTRIGDRDRLEFEDFFQADTSIMFSPEADTARYYPVEETRSYVKENHTFIEAYCAYYAMESIDDKEVQYKYLGNDFYCEGGQSQLARIRIIQTLNEYYGDWKWVGDPTAKIVIACKSTGGPVVMDALKRDEYFYYGGNPNPGEVTYWSGIHWAQPDNRHFKISGYGFRLRDHVAQVITIDSPFKGIPIIWSEGWYADDIKRVVDLVFHTNRTLIGLLSASMNVRGDLVLNATSGAFNTVHAGLDNVCSALDKLEGPAMHDLAYGSDFMENVLKDDGHAPVYSPEGLAPGKQIPVTCIVGKTGKTSGLLYAAAGVMEAYFATCRIMSAGISPA